jgi:hypothetical protein
MRKDGTFSTTRKIGAPSPTGTECALLGWREMSGGLPSVGGGDASYIAALCVAFSTGHFVAVADFAAHPVAPGLRFRRACVGSLALIA